MTHHLKCKLCNEISKDQQKIQKMQCQSKSTSEEHVQIYIKCIDCESVIFCNQCCKKHLTRHNKMEDNQIQDQKSCTLKIICQQCQNNESIKYCSNCEQHLCQKCSFQIHNKGKRAKHLVQGNATFLQVRQLHFQTQITYQKQKIEKQFWIYQQQSILQKQSSINQPCKEQVHSINQISIEQIQNWLNKYPIVEQIFVNQKFSILKQTILINSQQLCQSKESQQGQIYNILLKGFKISVITYKLSRNQQQFVFIQTKQQQKQNQSSLALQTQSFKQSIECYQLIYQKNLSKQTKAIQSSSFVKHNPELQSPQSKKFLKKQSEGHSQDYADKFDISSVQPQKKLKKALKIMNNKSLIIEIPQLKQYKESPIKSDRQQMLSYRNEDQSSLVDKTLMLNLDENENYNQMSCLTQNVLQNLQDQDNQTSNEESILMMGNNIMMFEDQYENEISKQINDHSNSEWNSVNYDKEKESSELIGFISVNLQNISSSTQNSIRKKSKKIPIPYFQPYKHKQQNLNNSMFNERTNCRLQKKMRDLAQSGVLMIQKDQVYKYKLNCEDKMLRKFKRLVCEEEVDYVALHIDTISIESIVWVLESIKQDKMTPTQKLVLSRLKQSFSIKLAHKLWLCILKYLESPSYQIDKLSYDKQKKLPQIIISRQQDDILLQYDQKWVYDDQLKLNQSQVQWNLFVEVLSQFFKKNKQITGGRYGCVQYVKRNGPPQLKICSLGKISLYVQQAINKGIIRYHKTLLIPNTDEFDKKAIIQQADIKLLQIQKDLKILVLKCSLLDMFLEAGPEVEISLAQIPLTFKKIVLFDVNLLELGFPKLKNLLQTISNLLSLSSSKSHIRYEYVRSVQGIQQLRLNLSQLSQYFIGRMYEIITLIMKNKYNIIAEQLYYIINQRLGFEFDYKVCNVPDFYQFLIHYCHQSINLQFINGIFVAFSKSINFMSHYGNNYNCPNFNQNYYSQSYNSNFNDINLNWSQAAYGYQNITQIQHPKISSYQTKTNSNNSTKALNSNNLNMNTKINSNKINYNYQQQYNYQNGNYQNRSANSNFEIDLKLYSETQNRDKQDKNQQDKQGKSNNKVQTNHHQGKDSQISQISTPKFNSSIQYINSKSNQIKTINNFKWESYFDILPSFQKQKQNDQNDQNESFTDLKSIYNIIDDQGSESRSKASCPKTVIQKQGSFNNMNNQLYISKITPIDQKSDYNQNSIDFLEDLNIQERQINLTNENKLSSKQKGQHNRVYSTAQARTKHQRMYSTTTSRN